MTDDYVRLGYWAWSVPVQTTVDRAASASLSAFLSESAVPRHEGSVSGSNDPVSADLHDDTSSLQLGSRLTEGNPGGGAFPGDGEQLPRVNIDQADGMSCRAQTHNEQEPVSLQTVVDILRGFETKFNQIEGRFSDFNDRFSSLNQAIGRDMRWLRQRRYRGHLLVGLCQLLSLFCSLRWCPRHVRLLVVHLGRRQCGLDLYLLWAIILKTVCQPFITSLSVVLVYLAIVARLIWLVSGGW